VLDQLYKRVGNLEKSVGINSNKNKEERFSWSFNINVQLAVITNPIFGKLSGIKSAEEGKNFSSWTVKEQQYWEKHWKEQISKKSQIFITYLAKEDAFFYRNCDGYSRFAFNNGSERDVYMETIIEEKDSYGFGGDSLSFYLRDRYIELEKTRIRVLTVYLLERLGVKHNYKILCDFPFIKPLLIEEDKLLDFEVEHSEGDVYKDESKPFGPSPGWSKGPDFITWRKNGVEIDQVAYSG